VIRVKAISVLDVGAFEQAYVRKGSYDFVGSRLTTRSLSFQLGDGPPFRALRGNQLQ